MGLISSLVKTGLLIGASITAYQASIVTKDEKGKFNPEEFLRNFKDLAAANCQYVVDSVKSAINGGEAGEYRYSDEGENGYSYTKSAPAEEDKDKVDEVFETVKEKAPEVIDKVQDFVADVRENAPEYKEKAQEFIKDVKAAAKKALETKNSKPKKSKKVKVVEKDAKEKKDKIDEKEKKAESVQNDEIDEQTGE